MILVNPNAPTGELLSIGEVHKLMEMNKNVPIIIDEAYIDFAGPGSALSIANRFSNLLVTRSLSKSFSLAGIRAGYAIGSEDYINMMRRVKNTFNSYPVSTVTNAIMRKVLKRSVDNKYIDQQIDNCEKIVATRERVSKALGEEGFFVFPSKANFLLIRHDDIAAKKIHSELRKKKILVRHFPDSEISDYIRVSIGTDEEMDVFLEEITSLQP
jgi:histidinol-phosphate aminotransferase